MFPQEIETFKKHNFGHFGSLIEVKINRWLIGELVSKWDVMDHLSIRHNRFMSKNRRIFNNLGVPYNAEFLVAPSFNQGFKLRMSKTLGMKLSFREREARQTIIR